MDIVLLAEYLPQRPCAQKRSACNLVAVAVVDVRICETSSKRVACCGWLLFALDREACCGWLTLVLDRHVAPLHSVVLVLLVVLERLARSLFWFVLSLRVLVEAPYELHVQPTCVVKDRSGDR